MRKQLFGLAASRNFGIEMSGSLFWFCSDPIVLSDFFFLLSSHHRKICWLTDLIELVFLYFFLCFLHSNVSLSTRSLPSRVPSKVMAGLLSRLNFLFNLLYFRFCNFLCVASVLFVCICSYSSIK